MEELHVYRIEVRGRFDGGDLLAGSPLPASVERIEAETTWMVVQADQSGLIGFLRYLQARGIPLTAIETYPSPTPPRNGEG